MTNRLKEFAQHITQVHIFVFLVIFLVIWRVPFYGKLLLDDAFITFRYAANLANHGTLVFNLGENVLGTTTPLWAVILAGGNVLHLPIPQTATVLNLVFEAAGLYIIGLMLFEFDADPRWRKLAYFIVGLLMITNRNISFASAAGMETPLFILLNMLTLWFAIRQRYVLGAITGSFAMLVRPDSIFVLVVLGLDVMLRKRRLPIREVLISLVIGVPWAILAYKTYGSFIPHSVTAKDAIAPLWVMTPGMKLSVLFYQPLRWFVIFTFPLILWGVWELLKLPNRRKYASVLLFTIFQFVYLFLPNNLGFDWYFVPAYTMLNLLTGIGLISMLTSANASMGLRWLPRLCAVALIIAVPYVSVGNFLQADLQDQIFRRGEFPALQYLVNHAQPNVTIQSDTIGILGYFSDYRLLDSVGLISPEVDPLIRTSSSVPQLLMAVAQRFQPAYIFSTIRLPYSGYRLIQEFATPNVPFLLYEKSSGTILYF